MSDEFLWSVSVDIDGIEQPGTEDEHRFSLSIERAGRRNDNDGRTIEQCIALEMGSLIRMIRNEKGERGSTKEIHESFTVGLE